MKINPDCPLGPLQIYSVAPNRYYLACPGSEFNGQFGLFEAEIGKVKNHGVKY